MARKFQRNVGQIQCVPPDTFRTFTAVRFLIYLIDVVNLRRVKALQVQYTGLQLSSGHRTQLSVGESEVCTRVASAGLRRVAAARIRWIDDFVYVKDLPPLRSWHRSVALLLFFSFYSINNGACSKRTGVGA